MKAEFKTCRVQVPPKRLLWQNAKQTYVVIFYICLYFFFKIGSSLEPLCHTKPHDKSIFTHPLT